MPDIDEIVELLQRRAEELNASLAELVGHSRDRVTHILEDEGLGEVRGCFDASSSCKSCITFIHCRC